MTSQIRSHTEYLMHIYAHLCSFLVEIDENSCRNGRLYYDLFMIRSLTADLYQIWMSFSYGRNQFRKAFS